MVAIIGFGTIGCGCAGYVWYQYKKQAAERIREIHELRSLRCILIAYAEQHDGNLPPDWSNLSHAGLIKPITEGKTLHIQPHYKGKYVDLEYCLDVLDIHKYKIYFGLSAENIVIQDGEVKDINGDTLLIIAPTERSLCKIGQYKDETMCIAEVMKAASR